MVASSSTREGTVRREGAVIPRWRLELAAAHLALKVVDVADAGRSMSS